MAARCGRATAAASAKAALTAQDAAISAEASSDCAEVALEVVKEFAMRERPPAAEFSYPKATAAARGIAASASRMVTQTQDAAAVAIGGARETRQKAHEILKELQAACQAAEQAVAAAEAAEQAAVAAWGGFTRSGGGGGSRMDLITFSDGGM